MELGETETIDTERRESRLTASAIRYLPSGRRQIKNSSGKW